MTNFRINWTRYTGVVSKPPRNTQAKTLPEGKFDFLFDFSVPFEWFISQVGTQHALELPVCVV